MYVFLLDIGDWSGDGHGQHERYPINSNKSVDEVRKAYFAAVKKCKKLKLPLIDPGTIFASYQESELTEQAKDQFTLLGKIGTTDTVKLYDVYIKNLVVKHEYDSIESDSYVEYILAFMMFGDPELTLTISDEDELPTFNWAGKKKVGKKQEYCPRLGYGLFGE